MRSLKRYAIMKPDGNLYEHELLEAITLCRKKWYLKCMCSLEDGEKIIQVELRYQPGKNRGRKAVKWERCRKNAERR